MKNLQDLKIKIFGDGADKASMLELLQKPYIKGFTTNPTLMRKAGVSDYVGFAKDILSVIKTLPVSFEVFSDDLSEMERQARTIASWGDNVYVKIPITNTKGESTFDIIKNLSRDGVKLNITAIFTPKQVEYITQALSLTTPAIISVFAGRVADTGVDPVPLMRQCKEIVRMHPNAELLWASPRELFNIIQADEMGCDIITVTPDVLKKLDNLGYDLEKFSLDTVKMFFDDGQKAGYALNNSDPNGDFIKTYFSEVKEITDKIDKESIKKVIEVLKEVRSNKGRLFIIGVGGSAASASHAVNDFRKIGGIETYAPSDNVSELTARTNDDGFQTIFSNWLKGSNIRSGDAVMVFSVGGGNEEKNVSVNIVEALKLAKEVGAKVLGIVGRDGGYTRKVADASVLIPVVNENVITPHTESFHGIVWHLIVSHPDFKVNQTKWESIKK